MDDDDEFLYGEEPVDGDDPDADEDDDLAGDEDEEESFALPSAGTSSRRKVKEARKHGTGSKGRSSKSKRPGGSSRSAQKHGRRPAKNEEDEAEIEDDELGGDNYDFEGESEDEAEDDDEGVHQNDPGNETVFIDNLPNDEFDIRRMLKDVRRHIKILEKQFFEEEDSEKEDELKKISNVAKHEEALAAFKEHAHLKQFWCIPLSVNVTTFNFDKLG